MSVARIAAVSCVALTKVVTRETSVPTHNGATDEAAAVERERERAGTCADPVFGEKAR